MAKSMVTRTIKMTKVTALCLDVSTEEPYNETVMVAKTFKDDKKLLEKVAEMLNDETHKVVHIVDKSTSLFRFGMDEEQFLALAKPLPLLPNKVDLEE